MRKEGESLQYKEFKFGTGENKIQIMLLDEIMEQGLAGMISSPMFKENIAIVVEDNPSTIDYDFACLGYTKKKTAPRVMMKRNFFEDLKCGTPESRMILFHEIGHYANQDFLTNDGNTDAEREALVVDGGISEKEIKADAFAASYLGNETVIEGLEALKKRILTDYADYDEESVRITIKEIDIRISHIKGLED